MKKTIVKAIVASLCATIGLTACQKETTTPATAAPKAHKEASALGYVACGNTTTVDLIAGQNTNAGSVTVANDLSNLYVTYTTTGTWNLTETHLYVGDCELIPKNGPGNPTPGRFPYNNSFKTATQQYTVTIPLSNLPACYCIAAHAVVNSRTYGTETAWGAGTRFVNKGNWGTYFNTCTQICNNND